ncbi:MAG: beta-galactosidase trimerization domain-containing protein [Faecalibacterium sp.]|jgi:beta-galactosidase|nr:beta-galactosidase trimerization domain-containing protein [Faecalibacterium sp.]
MANEYLLEMNHISKSFGRVQALSDGNLRVRRGTVHALMGENGAGKSTLMKCLFGIYHKDAGEILLDGASVAFSDSSDALAHNVAMVHQELNQVLFQNVMENVWLGRYPLKHGLIDEAAMYRQTKEIFDRLDIEVDPRAKVGTLQVAQKPYWVMEQQAGACGWSKMGPTPTPGKLRLWTYDAVANGADTVVYFRWRTALFGLEQYWHGILDHDGKPGRRYQEIAQIGAEMEHLSQTYKALMPHSKVAILKSFDSEWSHSIHRHVEGFQYDRYQLDFYRAFYKLGISVDFVSPDEQLSGYDLVLAPAFLLVSNKQKDNLANYARNGGTLLLTLRSGIKDEYNAMLPQAAPGVFSEMAGVVTEDYDPQMEKQTDVSGVFGKSTATLWCDILKPTSAKPLGVYLGDFYAGKPCMTVNDYGEGHVYYLGCDLGETAMEKLARYLAGQVGLPLPLYSIPGVEIVHADDGAISAMFVLNHNSYPVLLPLGKNYQEMIDDSPASRTLKLEAYGVAILKPAP